MRSTRWLALPAVCLLTLSLAEPSHAQIFAAPEGQARAGHAQEVAPWAKPSDTGRYVGYEVGGGSLSWRKGEAPYADDGTWGWDYSGGLFRRRVILNWWHGRRYQGGIGAYVSDGPKLLPHE
jgi:hypothetical protein